MSAPDLDALNQREYRKLLLALKTRAQRLELLLAICDDRNLQARLIADYETELKAAGITPFQVRLDLKQPSLRATLERLVEQEPALQQGEPAVVTVLNANELLGTRLTEEPSEQERFFFSLQWTREALRQFAFPIVLWLGDALATRLAQRAPDFWSWRGGVFEFVAHPTMPDQADKVFQPRLDWETVYQTSQANIADLERQIAQLQATTPESPLLATLYNDLGQAYAEQYAYQKALELYQKALELARAKNNQEGQARAQLNLGDALHAYGRPSQALDYYQQALALYRQLADRSSEAAALNQLGKAYDALGQYQQAIELYEQSLAIVREIGNRKGESNSLGNLGNAYGALGQYQRAIELYQQSLAIQRAIGDHNGEASSLFNLALILARYAPRRFEALERFQQARAIYAELGLDHKVEKCDEAIHAFNQIVATKIGPLCPSEESVPPPLPPVSSRSSGSRSKGMPQWQQMLWLFGGSIAIIVIAKLLLDS